MGDAEDLLQAQELADELLRTGLGIQQTLGRIAARYELTVQQVMFLRALRAPIAMSTFADSHGCDPSNVTGLVDRVARRGLVQRHTDPDDRRVRLLSLTPEGEQIRDRIDEELAREIARSFDGSSSDRADLHRLLRRI
jgi:DNA-binding MarR family transcriptional regulator